MGEQASLADRPPKSHAEVPPSWETICHEKQLIVTDEAGLYRLTSKVVGTIRWELY